MMRQLGSWRVQRWLAAMALAVLVVFGPAPAVVAQQIDKIGFSVAGGDKDLTDRLIRASALVSARENDVTDVQELIAVARNDYGRMVAVLWEEGFLGATVSITVDGAEVADLSLVDLPDRVTKFRYIIRPGQPYAFDDLRVGPLAPGTELPDGFARGQVAALPVAADAARTALDAWEDDGHAKVDISGERIVADHPARVVDADIGLAPGPQVTLGTVTLSGNRTVRSQRIMQILGFPTGEVYSPKAVQDAANRLRNTGAFRSVTLTEAETVNPDGSLDFALEVAEGKPRRLQFGAEYSNVDGVELNVGWTHRNLRGGAERLELTGRAKNLGGTTFGNSLTPSIEFSARYVIPAVRRADTDFFLQLGLSREDEDDYEGYSGEFGAGYVRRFSDEFTGSATVGLHYSNFDNAFGNDQRIVLAYLQTRLTYDGRDDFINPKKGYYFDTTIEPFLNVEGSANGARFYGDGRAYASLGGGDKNVLAARVQLGSIVGPSLSQVPSNELFYAGGGGTIRGRKFQSLGVPLPNGLRSGGRSYLGLSAEYRRSVTDTINAVAFYDWGYIGAESFPDGSGDSQAGAGLGVRYITPIGPLRVDLATPVGPPPSGNSVFLYIGVGQAF